MRTTVEVVAELGPGPGAGADGLQTVLRTVLRTVRAQGQALAVRRTWPDGGPAGAGGAPQGAAHVHLVGAAAGPLGGDEVEVRLVVGPGACLHVAGVAATVVLPSRGQARARLLLEADVAAGGRLVCALPPVVVTGRAGLDAQARVRLAGDGQVRLVEHVRLGRHGEAGGWWRGRLDVTRDGVALLRQTTTLGEDPEDGFRELRSDLDTAAPSTDGPVADGRRVVMDLARGGTLAVVLG